MKKIALILIIIGSFVQAQESVRDFDNKLQNVFEQKTPGTAGRQIIFSTLEASAAVWINLLISNKDKDAIKKISHDIQTTENSILSVEQKESRLLDLRTQLAKLEGDLVRKYANKTIRFLVRGSQVFLVFEVGLRFYILETIPSRDPGVLPIRTFVCSEIDCPENIDNFLNISNKDFEDKNYRYRKESTNEK